MKEFIVFLFLFLIVFSFSLFVFNGRFIYAQIKYRFLGPAPVDLERINFIFIKDESYQIPQRLVILSLGIDAPVVWPENSNETALQKALEKGVVFWPGSSLLEEKGTMIILGHSSAYPWYKGNYGSIFSLLNKLSPGDEILIFSPNKKYIYQVVEKEIELPKNLNIEKQEAQSVLYLLSCWPIRTDWKRIAIKAIGIDRD
ncbi:MAG: sortase [Patescibacteria group bacterium]